MSLPAVCDAVATIAARVPGIATVHGRPPDQLGALPAAWVHPPSGTVRRAGDALWLHAVELIVYAADRRANLPAEFWPAVQLVNPVEAAFAAADESGEFSHGDGDPNLSRCVVARYEIGLRQFAGKEYVGVTFTIDVKEHTP